MLIGSYTSATAATISQVAERYEVPYLSMDNSSPSLSQRGLKWFFRTTPHDEMFTEAMFDFFRDIGKKTGRPVKSVALVYEDSIFGTDSSNVQRSLAQKAGIKVVADIKYRANSPSLSTEAQRLKAANADVLMPSSYTNDAILLLRAMNEIGYRPRAIMAQAAGFQEQDFIKASGAAGGGRVQPLLVRARRGQRAAGHSRGERRLPGEDRQGPQRQLRPRGHRPAGDGGRHQPRRLGQARGDPQGAGWRPPSPARSSSCRGRACASMRPARTSRRPR